MGHMGTCVWGGWVGHMGTCVWGGWGGTWAHACGEGGGGCLDGRGRVERAAWFGHMQVRAEGGGACLWLDEEMLRSLPLLSSFCRLEVQAALTHMHPCLLATCYLLPAACSPTPLPLLCLPAALCLLLPAAPPPPTHTHAPAAL